jgi:hypothetical protein
LIFLLFGFTSLVYLFPIISTDATKHERGLTINASSTTSRTETEKICNDGKIGLNEQDCASAPTSPTGGTCGLKILSGVPIDYGPLNPGQKSLEEKVKISNQGTAKAKIMISAGDWIGDASLMSGPEITHVALTKNIPWDNKLTLKSNAFELGELAARQSAQILFQLKVPRAFSDSGSFHQDVTIDLIC